MTMWKRLEYARCGHQPFPANLATGVPVNQIIYVTFNEKMNPATITQSSFTLSLGTSTLKSLENIENYLARWRMMEQPLTSALRQAHHLHITLPIQAGFTTAAKIWLAMPCKRITWWTFTTEPEKFTVTLVLQSAGQGGRPPSRILYLRRFSYIAATSNAGYTFTNWTEGANVISTNTNYTFTIAGTQDIRSELHPL